MVLLVIASVVASGGIAMADHGPGEIETDTNNFTKISVQRAPLGDVLELGSGYGVIGYGDGAGSNITFVDTQNNTTMTVNDSGVSGWSYEELAIADDGFGIVKYNAGTYYLVQYKFDGTVTSNVSLPEDPSGLKTSGGYYGLLLSDSFYVVDDDGNVMNNGKVVPSGEAPPTVGNWNIEGENIYYKSDTNTTALLNYSITQNSTVWETYTPISSSGEIIIGEGYVVHQGTNDFSAYSTDGTQTANGTNDGGDIQRAIEIHHGIFYSTNFETSQDRLVARDLSNGTTIWNVSSSTPEYIYGADNGVIVQTNGNYTVYNPENGSVLSNMTTEEKMLITGYNENETMIGLSNPGPLGFHTYDFYVADSTGEDNTGDNNTTATPTPTPTNGGGSASDGIFGLPTPLGSLGGIPFWLLGGLLIGGVGGTYWYANKEEMDWER